MQIEQIGYIEVRSPETDPEAIDSALGPEISYDKYYRDEILRAIPDSHVVALHQQDTVERETNAKNVTACVAGDEQLSEAGAAEISKYCGGPQVAIRTAYQIPGRERRVVLQLLGPANIGEIAPGVRLELDNVNTAGQTPDYSDSVMDEFQLGAADVGIEMKPRTPGLERGEGYEPTLAAGKKLREVQRHVSKATGHMVSDRLKIATLSHPTIVAPLETT